MSCMNKHANMAVIFKEKEAVVEERKKNPETGLYIQSFQASNGFEN